MNTNPAKANNVSRGFQFEVEGVATGVRVVTAMLAGGSFEGERWLPARG
jgi:hypothetical protein